MLKIGYACSESGNGSDYEIGGQLSSIFFSKLYSINEQFNLISQCQFVYLKSYYTLHMQ